MNQDIPKSEIEIKEQRNAEILSLARELSERTEAFPFPGIESGAYARIKADDEAYPGYTTPIDEIINRGKTEGIKIVVGTHQNNVGNVYALPKESNDIENDCILPKTLEVSEDMDESLRQLILKDRARS